MRSKKIRISSNDDSIHLRLPKDINNWLNVQAEYYNCSVPAMIRIILNHEMLTDKLYEMERQKENEYKKRDINNRLSIERISSF